MIVLLGRERASIYLWNDSFGGVRERTTNDCVIGL